MTNSNRIGRNDPCPCGSGKKFKHCCLGRNNHNRIESLLKSSAEPPLTNIKAPKFGKYIRNLVNKDKKLQEGLAQVEKNAENFVKNYCIPTSIPDENLRKSLGAKPVHHIHAELSAFQSAYGRRIATMYIDSINAIDNKRLHLAALSLRAYLELTGAHLYFEQRLSKQLVDGVRNQNDLDKIYKLLRSGIKGGRFKWEAFALGGPAMEQLVNEYAKAKNHKDEPSQDIHQKSSAAFVAELEKHLSQKRPDQKGKVRTIYAMLCDICHPSVGGDLLFAQIPQRQGYFEYRAEPHDEMVKDFIRRIAGPVFLDLTLITIWTLNRIGQIADSLYEKNQRGGTVRISSVKDR